MKSRMRSPLCLSINYYANKKGNLYDPEYIKDGSIEEKTEYA